MTAAVSQAVSIPVIASGGAGSLGDFVDVFTTGSTIEACARALKRAGAARILVLTLARVVRPLAKPL